MDREVVEYRTGVDGGEVDRRVRNNGDRFGRETELVSFDDDV